MAGIKSFNKPNKFFAESYSDSGVVRESLDSLGTAVVNVASTASFKYDSYGDGIKSTQQINTDFSKFENHTFFNSAQAIVNVAFDKIINNYPFDGTLREIDAFIESLTGFEKYVYDKFPKNKGYLLFDGSSYISTVDKAGTLFPTLSKDITGKTILDPGVNKSFSIEMQLFVPSIANDIQCICQKRGLGDQNITLLLNTSALTTQCQLSFYVIQGGNYVTASCSIVKGKFNHIVATLDRQTELNKAAIYVNQQLIVTSSNAVKINAINFESSNFTIGTGDAITIANATDIYGPLAPTLVTPTSPLSGAIDELRVFHSTRTIEEQKLYAQKSIFGNDNLKLYYKFNEPSGTLGPTEASTINSVVLDSSGNSLHAKITNYVHTLRLTSSLGPTNPMTYEKFEYTPVLFPSFPVIATLNSSLLLTASKYDQVNPNIITNLIPEHYFLEGQVQQAFSNITGSIGDIYTGTSIPGSGKLGNAQLMSSFLFVWAKMFDEIKIFIDAFKNLLHTDYHSNDTLPDNFLIFLANYYGFNIPSYFYQATLEQLVDGENIKNNISTSAHTLQYVQNQLLKRVLTNIQHLIKSKGTLYSVRTLIRTLGIDPDNSLRIREYGGPKRRRLSGERETKKYFAGMLNMSASSASLISCYLSGSRVEAGVPGISGSFVSGKTWKSWPYGIHGISNNPSDGLFTSGSWTYEAIYRYHPSGSFLSNATQSLARLESSGSALATPQLIANLTAITSSVKADNRLELYIKPGFSPADNASNRTFKLVLTGTTIFDGNRWNVSFGRTKHSAGSHSLVSSSYFLRCASANRGKLDTIFATASYFQGSTAVTESANIFDNISSIYNTSGLFIAIGNQTLGEGATYATYPFLNNTTNVTAAAARVIAFDGRISNLRFWSKAFKTFEWIEHVRNPQSFGVKNPLVNYNFDTTVSGSWERLRLDVEMSQPITNSNAVGEITLIDYSQAIIPTGSIVRTPWRDAGSEFISQKYHTHMSGTGFVASTSTMAQEEVVYSYISPYFDESILHKRVRTRSLKNPSQFTGSIYATTAPVYELTNAEKIYDDPRFSIDFSIINALDQDIIKMFSTLDSFDNFLGEANLLFAHQYPDLTNLRNIYFNRLTGRIRLDQFLKLFKWFDSLLSGMLEQLLPRKTQFLGINFIIENHMLERSKFEYKYTDAYTTNSDLKIFTKQNAVQIFKGGKI